MAGTYKVVMVGWGGVGKSALTLQYMYGDFDEVYEPTKVASYKKKTVLDGEEMEIDILDTAGQEDYAAVRDSYFRSGDGFLLVFSITEADTLDRISEFRDHILRVKDSDQVPMVLVGNKLDMESQREVDIERAQAVAESFRVKYVECSAKTEDNVQEAFSTVLRLIHQRKKAALMEARSHNKTESEGCCVVM
ncbi:ras-related protein Ral-A [Galendromus occidentalis]|uniref:Ras-related protein Ral-A n=1 Tax=Galendromus occidentalis TaxID=34638 RepID=A0AAJ6QU78_9ACAR|nr:ras-related protein Ral-A [Galendromus occidentalis]